MKKFFEEFKAFAMRGNVIDLAVGVVIGGAFGKITTSIVNDIIMPVIGVLTGGLNFGDWKIVLKEAIKKYKKCEIKGGLINGVVTDAAGMNTLADLPSREVLLARMLGSMLSPVSGLAIVLDQIAKKGEPAAE